MFELNETRKIVLPKGGELEITLSNEFLWKLSNHFMIPVKEVTDDHIRMFVWGATKTAIEKAENGDGGPA
jgi:hypothetical protein